MANVKKSKQLFSILLRTVVRNVAYIHKITNTCGKHATHTMVWNAVRTVENLNSYNMFVVTIGKETELRNAEIDSDQLE